MSAERSENSNKIWIIDGLIVTGAIIFSPILLAGLIFTLPDTIKAIKNRGKSKGS